VLQPKKHATLREWTVQGGWHAGKVELSKGPPPDAMQCLERLSDRPNICLQQQTPKMKDDRTSVGQPDRLSGEMHGSGLCAT